MFILIPQQFPSLLPNSVCWSSVSNWAGGREPSFDRVHFKEYGPYSLNFEIVYWVKNPDYNLYMDIQQAINLSMFERFAVQGIEFTYPTQLLYVNKIPSLESSATD